MRKRDFTLLCFTIFCLLPFTVKVSNYENVIPIDQTEYIPINIIYSDNVEYPPSTPNSVIKYDVQLEKISIDSNNCSVSLNSERSPLSGLGTHLPRTLSDTSSLPRSSYVFPPDNRSLVSPTTIFPYSSICKILVTAANGSRYLGTGAIIDDFHVLTCGHLVYIHSAGGWVSDMKIIPGADGFYEPFSHAYAINYRTYTWWVDYAMYMHDLAIITLDRKIGTLTGWMGMRTTDVPGLVTWYKGIVHTAGYPGDLGGQSMFYTSNSGNRSDVYNHWHWCDTAGGQSGSPIWMVEDEDQFILSVHTGGFSDGASANIGTRIDTYKFDNITTWLAEDSLNPPQDKPDFQISLSQDYQLTDITTNDTFVKLTANVTNNGLIQTNDIKVDFYLSNDTSITEDDYLLGNGTIAELDIFQSNKTEWLGKISVDVEDGLYYFGSIVDPQNNIGEYIESNNADYIDHLVNITTITNDPDLDPDPGPEEDLTFIQKIIGNPILLSLSIAGIIVVISIPSSVIIMAKKRNSKKQHTLQYRDD